MDEKQEKENEIKEKKENLETKADSENEKEAKENNNNEQENNIIIEQNEDIEINTQEKKINEKNKPEDKNEIKIENKEPKKENNIEEIKENNEIKINIIKEENNENKKIKNEIIDKENENEQIINTEEKEIEEDDDEPEYSKNDIEALYLRTKSNKAMKIEQFYEQKRHYFIMTEGGTPIYSRYGDEIQNCSLLATFSAIITKFTIFNNEKNSQEKLNYICNDNSIIAFLKKGKIVFIALSNKTDSLSFLYSQLELLYQQLLSIVTSERMPILEEIQELMKAWNKLLNIAVIL